VVTGDRVERELTRDSFGPDVEVCSFCGEPNAAGWWMGRQYVSVCRRCALEVLPCLMADALVGERGDVPLALGSLHRDLETVLKTFWRAAAIAIHRTCRAALEGCETVVRSPKARNGKAAGVAG
jgi:hypothetical protein